MIVFSDKKTAIKFRCSNSHKEFVWSVSPNFNGTIIDEKKLCPCGAMGIRFDPIQRRGSGYFNSKNIKPASNKNILIKIPSKNDALTLLNRIKKGDENAMFRVILIDKFSEKPLTNMKKTALKIINKATEIGRDIFK